jgi:hypothetical protein
MTKRKKKETALSKIFDAIKKSSAYRAWMKFAHIIGKVNTTILMTLFHILIIGIGKIVTLFGRKDLLDSKWKDRESYWRKREYFEVTKENLLKPY